MYRHHQSGAPILWLVLAACLPALAALFVLPRGSDTGRGRPILVLLLLPFIGWNFSSLTVTVDRSHLRWSFGPGFIRKSLRLVEIVHVEAVRTTLLQGWGIHWTGRGWLYNVVGFDAVWIHLKEGKRFLIGTDEPRALIAAIEACRAAA